MTGYRRRFPPPASRARRLGALLLLALWGAGLARAQDEEAKPGDPAAEAAALRDLQTMLEKMALDPTEQPRDREYALRALSRVREALESWGAAVEFYDRLLATPGVERMARFAVDGAVAARKSRDGHFRGAREFIAEEGPKLAKRAGELSEAVRRADQVLDRAGKGLDNGAQGDGLRLRPMQGAHGKDPNAPLWFIPMPDWLESRQPPRKEKGKEKEKESDAPTQLKFQAEWAVQAVQPDMQKLIQLPPEEKK
ncbi:MAG: hypothetical protein M5U26_28680 [Planctomycetota bacterium]|nr:hypothetical protein [Planctomycetota bacterium]